MSPEEEEQERIKRATQRAGYHLMLAAAEVLAAVSAALEELRGPGDAHEEAGGERIDIE